MTSSDRVVARRYAAALFGSAGDGGEPLRQELGEASRTLAPKLDWLKNPTVAPAAKKELIERSLGGLSPRLRSFFKLLIDKKRVGLLVSIAQDFGTLLDERAGRLRAAVRSASDLSPQELDALARRLKAFSGKEVLLEAKTDPELLGGVVVRMGDIVLDGSIQGQLRQLKARLTEA